MKSPNRNYFDIKYFVNLFKISESYPCFKDIEWVAAFNHKNKSDEVTFNNVKIKKNFKGFEDKIDNIIEQSLNEGLVSIIKETGEDITYKINNNKLLMNEDN
jgi:hypothetical protein